MTAFIALANCGPAQKTTYNIFSKNLNDVKWKDTLLSIRNEFLGKFDDIINLKYLMGKLKICSWWTGTQPGWKSH